MKNNNRHFVKASLLKASTVIEFEDILDFCRYAEQHASKEFFSLSKNSKFAVLTNGVIVQIASNDYQCPEDYKKALQSGFPNASDYYNALEAGISKFEEYDLIQKCGISDKHLYDEIQKQGFLEGFEKYNEYLKQEDSIKKEVPPANPYKLYLHARDCGFKNFKHFFEALQGGFTNAKEHTVAQEKGYNNLADYKEGIENGFLDAKVYKHAKEMGVKTFQQLLQKDNLELAYPELTHDQKVCLFLLSKLEQGKKASVNKLNSLLNESLEEYKDPETKKLFGWFTTALGSKKKLAPFLQENENVRRFGTYDADGEFFEVNAIKDRSVVIDGSNVAHNSVKSSEKPSIGNLILMVKYLKKVGFSDILIIADASLRHKLSDLHRLEELSKIAKYEIAPAATSADKFIISYVKSKHCLVISNDAFKEHKVVDTWTAMNIDYYRLTFMITDGEVFMPDLK